MRRINVKDQTVLVVGEGLQQEHFGLYVRFEIHSQTHDARLVLTDAHRLNIRIIRVDRSDELFNALGQRESFNVNDESQGFG